MSRPQTRQELAEAGRRKLEAFRAQKAANKALKTASAPQSVASPPLAASLSVKTASHAADSQPFARAASVLPLSTHAQPVSLGGSDEEAPDSRIPSSPASLANNAAASSDAMSSKSSAPAPWVPIPFTGRTGSTDSSSAQQANSVPEVAATVPAASSTVPAASGAYQSRLPPPPPVFVPRSRPPAGTSPLTPTSNGSSALLSNSSPWRPAMLRKGTATAGTSSANAQPTQSPVHAPVQLSNPAMATPAISASPQTPNPSSDRGFTAGRENEPDRHMASLFANAESPGMPVAVGSAVNISAAEADTAADEMPDATEASHLTLANERQGLPEVATGAVAQAQDAVGESQNEPGSPSDSTQEQDELLGSRRKLATKPESPDSPLVFPWSQGPNSTGAASAYASLSDSYLSRPPSQTPSQAPSQAPSPSKHAQHESFLEHVQRNSPVQPLKAKHAWQSLTTVTSPAQHAQHATSPSQRLKRPFDSLLEYPSGQSPAFTAANQFMGSPSEPALPIEHAFQPISQSSFLNGVDPVALRGQPPRASATARPHSPQLGSHPVAGASLQSPSRPPTVLQQFSSSGTLDGSSTADTSHTSQADNAARTSTELLHQQRPDLSSRTAREVVSAASPWGQYTATSAEPSALSHGSRNSQNDVASLASTGSHDGDATSGAAAAESSREADHSTGSMRAVHKGLGSHISLADSLANGGAPAGANKFTALQQHIDDLTREKFELARGLAEQQKMAASLAEENLLVTEDFNRQAEALQQTGRELGQLEVELQGQRQAMEQLAAERDACKSGAYEAADRSKSLAAEVVALEEKVLHVRSREIRLEKEGARLQEGLQEAEKQLQASRRDRAGLQSTIDMLQEEKSSLLVKLRRAASHSDALAQQSSAGRKPLAASQQAGAGPLSAPPPIARPASSPRSGLNSAWQSESDRLPDLTQASQQELQAGDGADLSDSTQQSVAGPSTSSRLVERIMAEHQQHHDPADPAASMQDVLPHSLARLLPDAAGDGAGVVQRQQQLLQSIHAMIGQLEAEKRSFLDTIHSSQAEMQDLRLANSELQRKLESQTQRLELAIQQQAHASPHALSPSSYSRQSIQHSAAPQLQQSSIQSQQLTPQLQPGNSEVQATSQQLPAIQLQQQKQQQPSLYQTGYVRSAPPTPQQVARRPLRATPGVQRSGVLGWLGNMIAPAPKPDQAVLAM